MVGWGTSGVAAGGKGISCQMSPRGDEVSVDLAVFRAQLTPSKFLGNRWFSIGFEFFSSNKNVPLQILLGIYSKLPGISSGKEKNDLLCRVF